MIWKEVGELSLGQRPSVSQLLTHKAFIPLLKVPTGNKSALLLQFDYETHTEVIFKTHPPSRATFFHMTAVSIKHSCLDVALCIRAASYPIKNWGSNNWRFRNQEINFAMRSKGLSNKGSSDNININNIGTNPNDNNNNNTSNSQFLTLMKGSICSSLFPLHHGKNTNSTKVLGKTHTSSLNRVRKFFRWPITTRERLSLLWSC